MGSRIEIDAANVLVNLDRVTGGAASAFFRVAGATHTATMDAAKAKWPVDTGATVRAFRLEATARAGELRSAIVNESPSYPVYKQTWSRYSKAAREKMIEDAEAERDGQMVGTRSPFVLAAIARGNTPESKEKISRYFASGVVARTKRRIAKFGVIPPVGFEKKQPWHWLIRRPAQAASGALRTELEADLVRLAKGG